MDFYERLTALMKERGLSHKMLENALGISNGSVSKWNKSTPNVKTLKKLEGYFGVTTDYLLTGEESIEETAKLDVRLTELDNRLKEYVLKLSQLSDEKQECVMKLIDLLK